MRNFKECAEMRKAVRMLCGRMVSEIVMTGDPPATIQLNSMSFGLPVCILVGSRLFDTLSSKRLFLFILSHTLSQYLFML